MKSNILRGAMLSLGVLLVMPFATHANEPGATGSSGTIVDETTLGNMKRAFAEMPVACRKSAQQGLRASVGYRGAANGLWSAELGHALVSYVVATGNLAIGWQSLAGSKGILWHASADQLACPQPPYR